MYNNNQEAYKFGESGSFEACTKTFVPKDDFKINYFCKQSLNALFIKAFERPKNSEKSVFSSNSENSVHSTKTFV